MKQFSFFVSSILGVFLIFAESLFESRSMFLLFYFMLFNLIPHCFSFVYFLFYHPFLRLCVILNLVLPLRLFGLLFVLFLLLLIRYLLLLLFLLLFFVFSLFSFLCFSLLLLLNWLFYFNLDFLIDVLNFLSSSCNVSGHVNVNIFDFSHMNRAHHEIND